ncbi:MAG: hypothetical protein J7L91_02570 [Candidatus Korarchaeota archaeon]|nr:hypothetical protein [Candidatus Korarchaeota archaeon]
MSLSYVLEVNGKLRRIVREKVISGMPLNVEELWDLIEDIYSATEISDRPRFLMEVLNENAPQVTKVRLLLTILSDDLAEYLARKAWSLA